MLIALRKKLKYNNSKPKGTEVFTMSEFDGEYHFSGETVQDDGKKPKRTRKAPDIAGKDGKIGKIILAVVAALLTTR